MQAKSQTWPLNLSYREFKDRGEDLVGLVFNQYTVIKELGKGSFGKVYKVKNQRGELFALKLLNKKEVREEPNPRIKAIRERLIESEPKLMRQCDSPNLIKLVDVFENDDLKLLIIEFCNGQTLTDEVKQRKQKRFSQKEAVEVIRHIINGIAELHKHSIVHRDLKTENVMKHEGIYKIIDFGFSKKLELSYESEKTKNTVLGTPTTMAPEVMLHQNYGLKADIWSIGIIFFEIVLGYSPYNSNNAKAFYKEIEKRFSSEQANLTQKGITLSEAAYDFLKNTLKVNPDARIGWREMVEHPLIKLQLQEPITGRFTERHSMKVPPVAEELYRGQLISIEIQIDPQEIKMKQQPENHQKATLPTVITDQKTVQKPLQRQPTRTISQPTNRFNLEKLIQEEQEAEKLKRLNERKQSMKKEQQKRELSNKEQEKREQERKLAESKQSEKKHPQRQRNREDGIEMQPLINKMESLSTVMFKIEEEEPSEGSEYERCLKLHLECLKTQFIYNQIFKPIQEKRLLDLEKRETIEFMHLLISRCFKNLSPLKEKLRHNPQNVHRAFRNLYEQVENLYSEVSQKFNEYDRKLVAIENKYMEIVKDFVLKVVKRSSEREKNNIIGGVELREDSTSGFGDFTKENQIQFTLSYIQKVMPKMSVVEGCSSRVKMFLNFYGQIMRVTLECLGEESFSEFVKRIVT